MQKEDSLALDILYQDVYIVAINKPHGLLVHPSPLARDADEFAMQLLRDQLSQFVYPCHRLDRKTGGVLLFALNTAQNKNIQMLFAERKIDKVYFAIVRGYCDDLGEIDYPLKRDDGTVQEAFTAYRTLARAELPIPLGMHDTSRYSLVIVKPETGRMHQIRKHFKHILHPIIGDRPHGCNKQNKFFKERWQMHTMLLHAASLSFIHPETLNLVRIDAPIQDEFQRMMAMMGWERALLKEDF